MSEDFNCGWIMLKRTKQYANSARQVDIYADGTKVGRIGNGEEKAFEFPPGTHSIYAKIDWCTTPPIEVDVIAGETTPLYLGSPLAGWKLALSIVYLFQPSKWIYLRKEP